MNRELLMLVEAIAREKNVDRDVVFGAIEMALAQATVDQHPRDGRCGVKHIGGLGGWRRAGFHQQRIACASAAQTAKAEHASGEGALLQVVGQHLCDAAGVV